MAAQVLHGLDGLRRRNLVTSLLAMGASTVMLPARAHTGLRLPLSVALDGELAVALQSAQPLVVMVSLERCPWCEVVRDHYLAPMREREGLHVVQLDMLGKQSLKNAAGELTTHGALVRDWGVKIAPTLVFLGAQGQEVADRLEGGESDFYSAYLDRRLDQARAALRA